MDCLTTQHFTPPILYNEKTRVLDADIIQDLELTKLISTINKDNANETNENLDERDKPIYEYIYSPTTSLGHAILEQITPYYTTDINYLKDIQTIIQLPPNTKEKEVEKEQIIVNKMQGAWKKIKEETSFCKKYSFLEWDFVKGLNTNSLFLQIMSIFNLASPLISLCSPLVILIIPFFILKITQVPITVLEYCKILKGFIESNPVFKICSQFSTLKPSQLLYGTMSAGFYIFTIYQNIMACVRFYLNIQDIYGYLSDIRNYLKITLEKMQNYAKRISKFVSLVPFKQALEIKILEIRDWKNHLDALSFSSPFSFAAIKQYGQVLANFYTIYDSDACATMVSYSFGFHGYMEIMEQLENRVNSGLVRLATLPLSKNKKKQTNKLKNQEKNKCKKSKNKFQGIFYPKYLSSAYVIKNDCSLSKNIIITAPNGGGKTTLLKTVMINALLCQQVGAGCFDHAIIDAPFTQFHCYLNIPDTSGRDSLFQAEARRCKTILDEINKGEKEEKEMHLCILDELYSGTNPEEAVESGTAFMKYLSKKNNVSCILTTHYTQLCKNLEPNKKIINMQMGVKYNTNSETNQESNQFTCTFNLSKGMSTVKGGLKVLKDLNYPAEMLV